MRLIGSSAVSALVALGGLIVASEGRAADLSPFADAPAAVYGESAPAMEFGSGWYLRGDGAYAEEDHPKFQPQTGTFDRSATSGGYSFGIGVGYKLNSYLRMDLTADYLDQFSYTAQSPCGFSCSLATKTYVWRYDALANAYIDLGTWYGITPYVGAGVGMGGTRQDVSKVFSTLAGDTATTQPSRDNYQLAWAGMAGFSYAIAPHALLDVGYRYLDLGRLTLQSPTTSVKKDITEQQVRFGLRYMVD